MLVADISADPARACHSLIRPLPAGFDAGTLHANLATLAERHPLLRHVRLFDESLRIGSRDADTRRAREARRAINGVARAVLLRYADGAADLVLVAHRRFVDRRALDQVATALVDPSSPVVLPVPAPDPDDAPPTVPWGLGDPARAGRTGVVGLTTTATSRDAMPLLVAATAVVLARYGGTDLVEFELVTASFESPTTRRSVALTVSDSAQAADLLAAAADPVGAVPAGAAAVGVLVSAGRAGDTYFPVLAPLFPVTLAWEHSADGVLSGVLHYDEGAVHPAIARQFARHVGRVVDALGRAQCPVGAIELVDAGEAASIVAAGRTPAKENVAPAPVHELFRSVAAAQPDSPALSDPDRTLSYAELDMESDWVADALRGRGVLPGDRVGVCLDRDVDLVVVLLGVLKAGAAYVPMDPAYPAERLTYTVTDAGVRLVISTSFPEVAGVTVLRPSQLSTVDTESDADAGVDDIAYVIYTSGSTGRPKGVAVPHRNVAALLAATTADLGLGPSDTWTLFHSTAFDFSVWEIWGALLSGGHLVVVPYFTSRDPEEFHDLLVRHRVTVLNQTPSAFTALEEVDARRPAELAVRLVIFGGEPLDTRILRDWFRRHPHTRCRVVNMFGITETTVHVTSQHITPLDVSAGSRSVGRALPGWSVSVRDTAGRVQPFGVPGEIYVGGAGVASHYLNAEELTAARFVHDVVTGQRVYRSGDLGRLRQDGRLDHLGRIDDQVKVRGFRIELGEIRSVLLEDNRVTAAVVVLKEDGDAADVRLDAYLVPNGTVSTEDLRRRAAERLPEYMVPATFTLLSELPLTVNGKVDVTRLTPAATIPVATGEPEGDPVLLAWREILGEHVGPHDDFFETGGNSLLAVRLSGALQRAGLPAVSLRELYVHSTPAEVSALVGTRELSEVGRRVRAAWAEALDMPAERIGLDEDFFEIGGTSLAAMRVAMALSDLVTLRDVMRCSRLTELVAAAERKSTEDDEILVRLTDDIAEPVATVVCVPYAGGNAVHFKPVADAVARLDARLAVAAVELPGHSPGSTVDDLRSFTDTAESIAAEIERTVTGPVVLWGHCNGSTLAIETARLLTERGRPVRHLFLAAMLVGSAEEIRKTLHDTEKLTFADIRQYLAEWTGTTELTDIGSGLEDLVTRAFRHDALRANEFLLTGRASGTWRPLTTPCTVVVTSDDKLTVGHQTGYREWELFVEDPTLREIDSGGHYFARTRPEQVAGLIVEHS
jgi:amino acid adenylation domain-containing protein